MEAFDYREVNKRIAMYRRRLGWTQEQLAERADLSKNFISKLETGASGARLDVYCRIAEALGVSLDVLVRNCAAQNSSSWAQTVAQEICSFNPLQKRMLDDFLVLLKGYEGDSDCE